ncbi:MAG: DUF2516 family protein [Kocuria sp.]|nr:DUF2516 family protein [Kocuria sp.]
MAVSPSFQFLVVAIVSWTNVAVLVCVAVICSLAFFHCLVRTKAVQFQRAFKRTRTFWLVVTGACCSVAVLSGASAVIAGLQGQMMLNSGFFLALLTATVCGVYLADVKPAVDVESQGPSAW